MNLFYYYNSKAFKNGVCMGQCLTLLCVAGVNMIVEGNQFISSYNLR